MHKTLERTRFLLLKVKDLIRQVLYIVRHFLEIVSLSTIQEGKCRQQSRI